jgi:hypothetical protein
VVPGMPLGEVPSMPRFSVAARGFFFVPALVGATFSEVSIVVFVAKDVPTNARESTPTSAPPRIRFRKRISSSE